MGKNSRYFIAVAVLLATAIIGIRVFLGMSHVDRERVPTVTERELTGAAPDERIDLGEPEEPSLTPKELLEHDPGLAKARTLQDASHSRIEFYGQVIDQFGESVEGATVNYSYTYYPKGILPAASWSNARGSVMTDAHGRFEIKGHEGVFLSLKSIAKSGYQFRPPQGLGYIVFTPRDTGEKRHIPDPNNPVQIPAWKKTETARELKRGEGLVTPIVNGQPRTIRFPDTDETVSVTFAHHDNDLTEENRGKRRWTARFSVENGGLIDSDDAFMYQAPEAGYQTTVEVSGQEHQWVSKRFYLKALDGKVYGRIQLDMTGYYGPEGNRGAVDIKYVLNPNGSRNLLSEQD